MANQCRTAQLKVIEFSKEGLGRGIWYPQEGQSQRVDIPFSMPGDEVCVRLFKKKGKVYQGHPLDWLHLSEDRIEPRCRHFGSCGGCKWQHVPYERQLKQKEYWIQQHFQPFVSSETSWHPIIPCQPPWQYRNKMELSFSQDKAGQKYLGLILFGTRGHVFQMQECHLIKEWAMDAVAAVSQWWQKSNLEAYRAGRDAGSLRTLTLREGQRTGDRMVMLTVSGNPSYALTQKQIQDFIASLRKTIEPSSHDQYLSIFLRIQQIAKGRPTQFYEMLLHGPDHIREVLSIEKNPKEHFSLNFRISPSSFFQPNPRQAEKLYSRAIQLSEFASSGILYDLYCGTGTLGICMAKQANEVIGIELSPESALDARENVKLNQLTNVSIHTGDVGHLLPSLLQDKKLKPDMVMVDPPRAGLDSRALKHLISLKSPCITYISCNPLTQAANIEELVKEGYKLRSVQPVDQFPQTIHVENIAVLTI